MYIRHHLKIASVILTSLIVSSVLVQVVFVDNSPTLNKEFVARVQRLAYQATHPYETYIVWRASRAPSVGIAERPSIGVPSDSGTAHADPSTGGSTAVLPNTPGDSQDTPHPVTKDEHVAQGYVEMSHGTSVFAKELDASTSEISIAADAVFEMKKETRNGIDYEVWYPVAAKAE